MITTVFDPYRAAQVAQEIDLIKAANPGCYLLAGVPYVATMTPTGIVLAKAGRRPAAPGQLSLFSAPSAPSRPKAQPIPRTKVKDGITYRLNENSRWERVDRGAGQAKPGLAVVHDDLPPLEDIFARADEVGSKYQDPTDPTSLTARRAADAIVDGSMGGLPNEARGVADLGARRRAKEGDRPVKPKITEEERIANTADSMKRYHDRMTAHSKTLKPLVDTVRAVHDDQMARNTPEWATFEGEPVMQVPGSNYVAVPVNGRKNSAKFDIIGIDPREYVTQLSKNEVGPWLTHKAIAAENDAVQPSDRNHADHEARLAAFTDDQQGAYDDMLDKLAPMSTDDLYDYAAENEISMEGWGGSVDLAEFLAAAIATENDAAPMGGDEAAIAPSAPQSTPADPYHAALQANNEPEAIAPDHTPADADAARKVVTSLAGTSASEKKYQQKLKAAIAMAVKDPTSEGIQKAIAATNKAESFWSNTVRAELWGTENLDEMSEKAYDAAVAVRRWLNGPHSDYAANVRQSQRDAAIAALDEEERQKKSGMSGAQRRYMSEVNELKRYGTGSGPMTKAAQAWEDFKDTAEALHKEANPEGDGDPCWDGYEQVGTKKKGGKTVPNCVPMQKSVTIGGAHYALAGTTLRRLR